MGLETRHVSSPDALLLLPSPIWPVFIIVELPFLVVVKGCGGGEVAPVASSSFSFIV